MSGLYIRKFIDRVAQCDQTGAKDFVWSMQDAKNLHGDITKLLLDIETLSSVKKEVDLDTIEVDGGTWQLTEYLTILSTQFMVNNCGDNEMSRPKPTILVEVTDKATYKTEQVLASTGIWAVYFEGSPINLKTSNMLVQYPGPKYKKVSFSNPGHAISLAKKLNTQFKTEKFSVVLLHKGEQVYPNAK